MCLFPTPNFNISSFRMVYGEAKIYGGEAYRRGLTHFECGACPECLSKRASRIMVRDVYEASSHVENCMITLTYDKYLRDSSGRIIGEQVADRKVDKRDCQLFIKRLRSFVWRRYGVRIKYRLSAEYGKKTHRPHYHCLIFGWCFPDCVFYKKSKRGSLIYKSNILNSLWRHGICTVDAKTVSPAIAKYCSKYTSKDKGAEDTFSLCSQQIGVEALMRNFNGLYYMVEGIKYPVPRVVWERYINDCYQGGSVSFSSKYVNRKYDSERNCLNEEEYECSEALRLAYRFVRDSDPTYQAYLKYWSEESARLESLKPPVLQRILSLSDDKYFFYKQRALVCYNMRSRGFPAIAPRSNSTSAWRRYMFDHGFYFEHLGFGRTCRIKSCLNTASDTKLRKFTLFTKNPFEKFVQIGFFSEKLLT